MFLKANRTIFKKISIRLTVIFAAIFVLGSFLILFLSYILFEQSLKGRDQNLLHSKARQYASVYSKGGVSALEAALKEEKQGDEESLLLVRVESSMGGNIYLHVPEKMKNLKLAELEGFLTSLKKDGIVQNISVSDQIIDDREDEEFDAISISVGDEKLEVMRSASSREDLLERFLGILIGASGLVLIVGSIGGFIFSNQAMAPLRNLIQTMKRIYSGELAARVPIRNSNDELDEIGKLFNKMTNKIERLILNMQETLDYVAHDLKTPLTRLKAKSELLLLKNASESEYKATLADTIENTAQIVSLIDTLMDISEAQAGILKLNRTLLNSKNIVLAVVELYSILAEEKNILIKVEEQGEFDFSADENRIKQVLSNLIDNAIKYSPAGSEITVLTRSSQSKKEIIVEDQGIGISKDNLTKIWDRLFRAEEARSEKGMGLGLNLVKSICQAHGWQIQVESRLGFGTRFTLLL